MLVLKTRGASNQKNVILRGIKDVLKHIPKPKQCRAQSEGESAYVHRMSQQIQTAFGLLLII